MIMTVLVKSPNGRNFKVNFSPKNGQTDYSAFKEVFYKICESDCDLSAFVKTEDNQRLLFQRFDKQFQINVDLTDLEEIESGTIIELFISTTAVLNLSIESTGSSSVSFNSVLSNNETSFISANNFSIPSTSQVL